MSNEHGSKKRFAIAGLHHMNHADTQPRPRTYRDDSEVSAVVRMNQQMAERIGLGAISTDEEIKEMAKPTSIDNVAQIIQENLTGE